MTIPPMHPGDEGWDMDVVVVVPDPATITFQLMPVDSYLIDLEVDHSTPEFHLVLGSQGPIGERGADGPPGPAGPAGEATSVVLTAPGGGQWQLVVDDSGVLSTVPV